MKPTLGGTIFTYNAEKHDYSYREAIACLKALCDQVIILDAGSDDGTKEVLKGFEDEKTKVVLLDGSEWAKLRGKEKLSYFQNLAISMLSTDWNILVQADECLHESCFHAIREAIEKDNDGYFVTRINLWGNSHNKLNVPHDRTPVGTQIIRLAKTKYFSVDDGEGVYCQASWEYLDKIRLYHTGFIRNKYIHTKKIEYMLCKVFGQNELDPKVVAMDGVFDPFINFSKEDLVPISEPLPVFIKEWATKRDEINAIIV